MPRPWPSVLWYPECTWPVSRKASAADRDATYRRESWTKVEVLNIRLCDVPLSQDNRMQAPPPRPVLSTDTGTRKPKHLLVVQFLWAGNSFKHVVKDLNSVHAELCWWLDSSTGFQPVAFSWSWKVLRTRLIHWQSTSSVSVAHPSSRASEVYLNSCQAIEILFSWRTIPLKQSLEVKTVPPSSVVQSGSSTKSSDTLLDGPTPLVRLRCKLSLPGALVSSHVSLFASCTITVAVHWSCTQAFPNTQKLAGCW